MINWITQNFNSISGWSSIFGFLLSIWVLYTVKKLRNYYLIKARTPEIIKDINNFSKELNSYLRDIENNKNEIIVVVKKCEFTLKSLRRKSTKDLVSLIDKMLLRISNLKKGGPIRLNPFKPPIWSFNDEAWELYSDMQGVLQGLKETANDSNWSQ